ncbi:MAG TPA: universal stress protein [Streptosporangiaceae bacterium]|jgi:nucleotide-binding universal stress UspA family protein
MQVLVWITPQTWVSCVEAAKALPPDAEIVLVAVMDTGPAGAAHGAYGGLLGRGGEDPAARLADLATQEASDMMGAAVTRLGRQAGRLILDGRPEQTVLTGLANCDLLIVARDGHGQGPKSLGKAVRFVVDHAPCDVLLIWPES